MTPHTSGTSLSAQARYADGTREILECFFDGKEIKTPRLMALITIKAGIIWSEMSEEEKNGFSGDEDTMVSLSATKKKGRPSGYKATDYVVDSAVESALNKSQPIDESDDEVELEEFAHEGATYFKDEDEIRSKIYI